jgi:hypothetical protein
MTDHHSDDGYKDIDNRFKYHPPTTPDIKSKHEYVRGACGGFAHDLTDILPESREKSLAITKLEEVMFWANAALARNKVKE